MQHQEPEGVITNARGEKTEKAKTVAPKIVRVFFTLAAQLCNFRDENGLGGDCRKWTVKGAPMG